ncbi:MAG: isopentenyl-diphosphate Delta-isomerase [Acidobacteriota bacterium]
MVEPPVSSEFEAVSSEDEELILVDESDRVIGHLPKGACHDGVGVLHRAFSIFIFNLAGELLLQRRSSEKRLWPLFWSNSCCSHPRFGETMDVAVERRLQQELGIKSEPEYLYTFEYQASYEDLGSEHEMCRVYAGLSDEQPRPHPNEIADHRWIDPAKLDDELRSDPTSFTPWFQLEWPRVRETYRSALGL